MWITLWKTLKDAVLSGFIHIIHRVIHTPIFDKNVKYDIFSVYIMILSLITSGLPFAISKYIGEENKIKVSKESNKVEGCSP